MTSVKSYFMKKSILSLFFLAGALVMCLGQNLIVNGDFETSMVAPWGGFNNQVTTDSVTNSLVGNVNDGEGSLFQEFDVTPGMTYKVMFQHRWVAGATNYNCIVRVKNAANLPPNLELIGGTIADGFKVDETPDMWFNNSFSFVPPAEVTRVRLLFYKANNNRPLRIDNVSAELDATSSIAELQPVNFSAGPNPAVDFINLSADEAIDRVELYSISGRLVRNQAINSSRGQVDVSDLAKGLYVVKAYIEQRVGTYKLVVK